MSISLYLPTSLPPSLPPSPLPPLPSSLSFFLSLPLYMTIKNDIPNFI